VGDRGRGGSVLVEYAGGARVNIDDLGRVNSRFQNGAGAPAGGVGQWWNPVSWIPPNWLPGSPIPDPQPAEGDSAGMLARLSGAWKKIQTILGTFRDVAARLKAAGQLLASMRDRVAALPEGIRRQVSARLGELSGRQAMLEREQAQLEGRITEVQGRITGQEEIIREGLTGAALGAGMGFFFTGILIVLGIVAGAAGVVTAALAWIKSSEAHIKRVELEASALDKIEAGEIKASDYEKIVGARQAGFLIQLPTTVKWVLVAGVIFLVAQTVIPMVKGK